MHRQAPAVDGDLLDRQEEAAEAAACMHEANTISRLEMRMT
jgi:hypothetical protein